MLQVALLVCTLVLGFAAQTPATAPQAPAIAGDVSGAWTGEVKSPVSYSPIPMHFKLQQKGAVVTGTAGPGPSSQFPISDVKRSGSGLHFSVSGEGGLTYTFDLIAKEDLLLGDAKGEDKQSNKWSGKASLKRDKNK